MSNPFTTRASPLSAPAYSGAIGRQPDADRRTLALGALCRDGAAVRLHDALTKQIGYRAWRLIHALSYLIFVGVTVHSVLLGTDSSTKVMQVVYILAGGSVLFLTLFRILTIAIGSAAPDRVKA